MKQHLINWLMMFVTVAVGGLAMYGVMRLVISERTVLAILAIAALCGVMFAINEWAKT